MISVETVSSQNSEDKTKFYEFHDCLKALFKNIFAVAECEDFDGSLLIRWRGADSSLQPVMLMNHHDVVEASGSWKYSPFSGTCAEGKVWGRGTLDTKSGLFAMLQAADELAGSGFVPRCDVYFVSTCTEESTGRGADLISAELGRRAVRFRFVLDEGGMIVHEPLGGAEASYAMIGVGEKGYADLKFTARSMGGHASTPGKDTPLVRLGKFMAATEKKKLFKARMSETVAAMLKALSKSMRGPLKIVLGRPRLFSPILTRVMPAISDTGGAMLKTTLAFTMAGASEASNVLPEEAWVIGNMRYSHHQGAEESIAAVRRLAEKYGVETEVLKCGFPSPLSDHNSESFAFLTRAVNKIFPSVRTTPYIMTAASDSRYMSRVSDYCFRFTPVVISTEQLESIHGINEYICVSALIPAVDFYKYIITEV